MRVLVRQAVVCAGILVGAWVPASAQAVPDEWPQFKDVAGFRGPDDLEKPVGEWNLLDLWCSDGTFTYFVNGTIVMHGKGASPRKGRILLQSEGAEIFFRKIEIDGAGKQ